MNEEELTQHEAIVQFLELMKEWVPSYLLSKTELCGTWVGSRGERSARDLVSLDNCPEELKDKVERKMGKDLLLDGFHEDAFKKPIEGRYAYYRAVKKVIEPSRLF